VDSEFAAVVLLWGCLGHVGSWRRMGKWVALEEEGVGLGEVEEVGLGNGCRFG